MGISNEHRPMPIMPRPKNTVALPRKVRRRGTLREKFRPLIAERLAELHAATNKVAMANGSTEDNVSYPPDHFPITRGEVKSFLDSISDNFTMSKMLIFVSCYVNDLPISSRYLSAFVWNLTLGTTSERKV